MSRRGALILLLFCTVTPAALAQDPAERAYHVPVLNPKHKDKPRVTGWANQRVEEKINRGLLAVSNGEGKVYLGWRLFKTDPQGTAFNVYRSVEGDDPVRLNKEPVATTTDFIDETPPGRECTYWVRPVLEGRELEPSEKVRCGGVKADTGEKSYYSSIKFQGSYTTQKLLSLTLMARARMILSSSSRGRA